MHTFACVINEEHKNNRCPIRSHRQHSFYPCQRFSIFSSLQCLSFITFPDEHVFMRLQQAPHQVKQPKTFNIMSPCDPNLDFSASGCYVTTLPNQETEPHSWECITSCLASLSCPHDWMIACIHFRLWAIVERVCTQPLVNVKRQRLLCHPQMTMWLDKESLECGRLHREMQGLINDISKQLGKIIFVVICVVCLFHTKISCRRHGYMHVHSASLLIRVDTFPWVLQRYFNRK